MEIRTASGVKLVPLPYSPSPDFMAGEDGRVWSRLRHKGFGSWEYVDWHPVGGAPGKRRTVEIEVEGRRLSLSLPAVICGAFHGLPPEDKPVVRHLDGDRENNRPENLAWGTQEEAWADEYRRRRPSGPSRRARRFSREDREHLRWALAVGLCSQREAARRLGVALSTVQSVLRPGPSGANGANGRDDDGPDAEP
ncbi:HNH endonuclease signature motif containing protein [Anaeromyxobacter paludicola]|uniref:HNH nuclease domain-containing protein n=1 Tax=Anaeromyxobacter paludicola TaxID=2918171 RepID=A0ABM7XBJ5_9BACT|nr:HNH endonuclease signature motif containing protein [Anaeromyxobacter paludicola]BDG09244.1 hypothetical protein AMPC_23570 [Anaeromyxobacter paludicola]